MLGLLFAFISTRRVRDVYDGLWIGSHREFLFFPRVIYDNDREILKPINTGTVYFAVFFWWFSFTMARTYKLKHYTPSRVRYQYRWGLTTRCD